MNANCWNQLVLAEGQAPGTPFMLMSFLVVGILFYFMLIRPERRKQAAHEAMVDTLKKNDRVQTIGGIFGIVVSVHKDDGEVVIRIDETTNTKIRLTRRSISRVLTDKKEKENE